MLWAMDLHYRPAKFLGVPDYFSRLGADLHLSRLYLSKSEELCRQHAPITGQMRPENMPGCRAPQIFSDLAPDDQAAPSGSNTACFAETHIAPLLTSIMLCHSGGHEDCLQTVPIVTIFLSPKE